MWLNRNDNSVLRAKSGVTIGGIQYPSNIFDLWSETELNEIGLFTIAQSKYPSNRYYVSTEVFDLVSTPPTLRYSTVAVDLTQLKSTIVSEINEKAKNLLAEATYKYSAAEMAGWETLEREAIQYLADGTVGNMLGGEAFMSNQDVDVLATEVVGNATEFRSYRNFIVSTRYKKTQAVNALTTIEELIAYDLTINDGWEVV